MGEDRTTLADLAEQAGTAKGESPAGSQVRTLLASSGSEPGWAAGGGGEKNDGGGVGDLSSDQKMWNGASRGVSSLRTSLKQATTKLDDKQKGFGASDEAVTGLLCGAAQLGLYTSWERYLDLVSRECGELVGKLTNAGTFFHKNDEAIASSLEEQHTKPRDPDAGTGHPSQGR